jgi:hypothetical protein
MKQLRLLVAFAFFMFSMPVRAQDGGASLEYGIKAVVLFNFAKYVQWPKEVFKDEKQPITVCTVGKNPVAAKFNSSEAPSEAQGHPFAFKEIAPAKVLEEGTQCQILFWQQEQASSVEAHLDALHKAHVLTVSDKESNKSAISFTLRNGKIRFIIRRSLAEKAGLELGSQLLKLAILEDE